MPKNFAERKLKRDPGFLSFPFRNIGQVKMELYSYRQIVGKLDLYHLTILIQKLVKRPCFIMNINPSTQIFVYKGAEQVKISKIVTTF